MLALCMKDEERMTRTNNSVLVGILLAASVSLCCPSGQAAGNRTLLASAEGRTVVKTSESAGHGKQKLHGRVEREVMEAEDLMGKRDYEHAADRYKDAITKNATNTTAIAGYGMALGKMFKLDAADEQFDKALALDSNNTLAHVGKAMVALNRLQTDNATVLKQRNDLLRLAETECRTALQQDASNPEAQYYLGQTLKEENRLDEAASAYQDAIRNDKDMSEAHAGLGLVRLAQGNPAEATASFKQAINLNSGNSTAHYGLGRALLAEGQIDAALKEFNTSEYQNRNSAPLHIAKGEALNAQGNTVGAIKEFQAAIGIHPELPDAYLHIADIRDARGDVEHAIADLHSGLELMPGNPELLQRVGDESLRIEKLDDAIKAYEQAMNDPAHSAAAAKGLTRAYYLKSSKEVGGAYLSSNDFETAKRSLDRAVQLNPNDMELRLAMAKIRSLSGEKVDLRTIGTPRTDGERVAYAEALLAQNDFKGAQDQMNQVIANAYDPRQCFAVGDLSLMIKDLDDAEAAYRKAASMPNGGERAKRGLDMVAAARENNRQDRTLATDLAKRKQLASAVDKYHAAIFDNPKDGDARYGLAGALQGLRPSKPNDLREAATQLRAYIALTPALPPKELEKLNKKINNLQEKAIKIEQKGK
jgi:tetratricopeptide (TPR) repeat protein